MEHLSVARLRELFIYDEATGLFTRRIASGNRGCNRAGEVAGRIDHHGYMRISIDGVKYAGHRLAWLYVMGAWPAHGIDHFNGVRADNRLENLRDVPQAINLQNQRNPHRNNSSSRFLGVSFDKRRGSWKACIMVNRKQIQIGRFLSEKEAAEAYRLAKPVFHGLGMSWPV